MDREAAPYTLRIIKDGSREQYIVRLNDAMHWRELRIAEGNLARAYAPFEMIIEAIRDIKLEMDKVSVNADYPDVREWAAKHLNIKTSPFAPIPGWIWPRWNSAHPGMKANKTGGVEPVGIGQTMVNKRRVVVSTKGATTNPARVRTPKCPLHTEQMVFNSVRTVWECPVTGCSIIAQPKNEPEQGRVTLGKGEIHLRIVCQENKSPAVILISDDNIALDITEMVNPAELRNSFDLDVAVKAVKNSGLSTISIPVIQKWSIKSKASVTNAEFYPPVN